MATRDWHPKETKHFKKFGGQWPEHCVENTTGAKFHPRLKLPPNTIIISKGMDPEADSYSAFQGSYDKRTEFKKVLINLKIKTLFVGGLATDYCVKSTVLDALKLGYKVNLLTDAIKGVNLKSDDSVKAIAAMIQHGAIKMSFAELQNSVPQPTHLKTSK